MEPVWRRCVGIDIGKKVLAVCLLSGRRKESRTFGTRTADLLRLRTWLEEEKCQAVAMEATGSYWKPVWNVLEDHGMELVLANPQRIKGVPGRKSDVRDAEWIADLLRHGLIPKSYVPSRAQRELRELERYRSSLVDERGGEANRLQKVLEGANLKLGTALTDIMGKSGRAILRAVADGVEDPEQLAAMADPHIQASQQELVEVLSGYVGAHQRFMLAALLDRIEDLDRRIEALDNEITERTKSHEKVLQRLQTIPGIGQRSAQIILAEVGSDVSHFPTDARLASWSGLVPGQNESAGKRRSSRIRPGNMALRGALVQCAWAAIRSRQTSMHAQYAHLAPRIGKKRAAVAVAHSLIVIVYHILEDPTRTYREMGSDYLERIDRAAVEHRALAQLKHLGYEVTLTPTPLPAA